MTSEEFKHIIENNYRDHKYREPLVQTACEHPILLDYLIKKMKITNSKNAPLAGRIVELVCKKNLKLLLPHLNEFGNALISFKEDAVIRSSAKLIELTCIEVYVKFNPVFIKSITEKHIEQYVEVCFDWMISNKATAIQAHSMYALYLLGFEDKNNWIHEELILNIDRNLEHHTIGYQNRGKKIIKAIKTNTFFKI